MGVGVSSSLVGTNGYEPCPRAKQAGRSDADGSCEARDKTSAFRNLLVDGGVISTVVYALWSSSSLKSSSSKRSKAKAPSSKLFSI